VADRFATRRRHLLDAAYARDCQGFLVTGSTSIRYLTGFTGSAGALLVLADSTVLATDGRYVEQAAGEAPGIVVEPTRDYLARLLAIASEQRSPSVRRIAAESDHLTWHEADTVKATLASLAGELLELVPTTGVLAEQRIIKDAHEIECIRSACAITQAALLEAIAAVTPRVSEKQLAQVFLDAIQRNGADGPAFEPIVAIGANSARPHHRPGHMVAGAGDLVLFDVGAKVEGYCSDISRTVALGRPLDEIVHIHAIVERAQAAGRHAVGPGVEAAVVHDAALAVIADAGYADRFVHGTGHGLGLDIHEPPLIGLLSEARLAESSTVTVEPGIYLPGIGGVRIEDTVLVTAVGAEPLTTITRALIEC